MAPAPVQTDDMRVGVKGQRRTPPIRTLRFRRICGTVVGQAACGDLPNPRSVRQHREGNGTSKVTLEAPMTALPQNESLSQDVLLRALTSAAEAKVMSCRKPKDGGPCPPAGTPMSADDLTDAAYDVDMALTAIGAIAVLIEGQVTTESPLPREAHDALNGVRLLASFLEPDMGAIIDFIESIKRDLSDRPQPGDGQD